MGGTVRYKQDDGTTDHSALENLDALHARHTGFEETAHKGEPDGYAALDADTHVPTAQLADGVADATTFLRGDGQWAVPQGGGGTTDHAALINLDAAHAGHTGFEVTADKGVADGYAALDGDALVPAAQLGTGPLANTRFLRADRTWAVPPGGGGGSSYGYFPGGWV